MQSFETDYPAINKALLAFRRKSRICNQSPPLHTVVHQIVESNIGKGAAQSYLQDCIAKRNYLNSAVCPLIVLPDAIQSSNTNK